MRVVTKTQTELNGNTSMMIKFCRIGHLWKHEDRVRSTMLNKSLSICPMYLTYKDHKGWSGDDGTPPPTRPIAGGNTGMNLHISEILSEIIEPMVDKYEGGDEVISTEDMKARIEILNEGNKMWNKWSWWEGKSSLCGKFVGCVKCMNREVEVKGTLSKKPTGGEMDKGTQGDMLKTDKESSGGIEINEKLEVKGILARLPENNKEATGCGMVKGTLGEMVKTDKESSGGIEIKEKLEVKGTLARLPENNKESTGCGIVKGTLEKLPKNDKEVTVDLTVPNKNVEVKLGQDKTIVWMGEVLSTKVSECEILENMCKCVSEEYKWWVENWEHYWETKEGQDPSFWLEDSKEEKIKKINPITLKKLRRQEWLKNIAEEDLMDENKVWEVSEVLQEDIQDVENKMVIVGSDVEALYPSLDVTGCGKIVLEEVMRTSITWEDLDYLEGTRMIVLNRSAEYSRRHELSRVLPVRRKKTGTRPGVTGKGPLGGERGDQEQWRWPEVKLTEREKRLIVAEVVMIVTEVMFKNHIYTFGGKTFRQKEGGPIGLRGTCAIARLTMCNWDRNWKRLIENNRILLNEYMRYMDDGRSMLPAIKPGWRWSEGRLCYTARWWKEDKDKTGIEITSTILGQSMSDRSTKPWGRLSTSLGTRYSQVGTH